MDIQPPPGQAATRAVAWLLRRMQQDGRLAYLIGPGSQSYDLLTLAGAEAANQDLEDFRAKHSATLRIQPWPSE